MPATLRLFERRAFAVIGIEGAGDTHDPPSWIQPLWGEALRRRHEVAAWIRPHGWGVMSGREKFLSPWDETGGRYLAGWELDRPHEAVSVEGWSVWRLPALVFAGFECALPELGAGVAELHRLLAARPDLRAAGAILEFYPPNFEGRPQDKILLVQIVEETDVAPPAVEA